MTITTVDITKPEDIFGIVSNATTEGTNLLLLYDDHIDKMLHKFLKKFARSDRHFSILISGKKARTIERFYKEVRYSIPQAGFMGSSLDALDDILGGQGIDAPEGQDVYWIWERSHVLFEGEPESFRRIFNVMAYASRQIRSDFVDSLGNKRSPWPDWSPQKVVLILTGKGEALLSEASRSDSFLYRFPDSEEVFFGDLMTQTVAYHLASRASLQSGLSR